MVILCGSSLECTGNKGKKLILKNAFSCHFVGFLLFSVLFSSHISICNFKRYVEASANFWSNNMINDNIAKEINFVLLKNTKLE